MASTTGVPLVTERVGVTSQQLLCLISKVVSGASTTGVPLVTERVEVTLQQLLRLISKVVSGASTTSGSGD